MLADGFGDRTEDHASLGKFCLERRDNRNTVEHGINSHAARCIDVIGWVAVDFARIALFAHASKDFLLAQRNTKLFVSAKQFRVDFIKRLRARLILRRRIIIDVLEVDLGILDACPCWLFHGEPAFIGLQTPLKHPFRLVFLGGNEANDIFIKPLWCLLRFDCRFEAVLILVHVQAANLINGLLHCRHWRSPSSSDSRSDSCKRQGDDSRYPRHNIVCVMLL